MKDWTRGTRVLFWVLAVLVACAIAFGVYDDLHKTSIIDAQRNQNYSLSDALTKAQKQLIDNGVEPNTKTPGQIARDSPAAVGATGAAGVPGLPGIRGQTGPEGPPGEPGPAGTPGRDGNNGQDGADGSKGADSTVAGPSGSSGQNGADSTVPGPPGPQGPKGDTGASGADGTNGTNGSDGRSVTSIACVMDGLSTYVVFYDQTQTPIGRVQEACVPN